MNVGWYIEPSDGRGRGRGIDPIVVAYRRCCRRRRRRTDVITLRRKSEMEGGKKTMRQTRWKSCARQVIQGLILGISLERG